MNGLILIVSALLVYLSSGSLTFVDVNNERKFFETYPGTVHVLKLNYTDIPIVSLLNQNGDRTVFDFCDPVSYTNNATMEKLLKPYGLALGDPYILFVNENILRPIGEERKCDDKGIDIGNYFYSVLMIQLKELRPSVIVFYSNLLTSRIQQGMFSTLYPGSVGPGLWIDPRVPGSHAIPIDVPYTRIGAYRNGLSDAPNGAPAFFRSLDYALEASMASKKVLKASIQFENTLLPSDWSFLYQNYWLYVLMCVLLGLVSSAILIHSCLTLYEQVARKRKGKQGSIAVKALITSHMITYGVMAVVYSVDPYGLGFIWASLSPQYAGTFYFLIHTLVPALHVLCLSVTMIYFVDVNASVVEAQKLKTRIPVLLRSKFARDAFFVVIDILCITMVIMLVSLIIFVSDLTSVYILGSIVVVLFIVIIVVAISSARFSWRLFRTAYTILHEANGLQIMSMAPGDSPKLAKVSPDPVSSSPKISPPSVENTKSDEKKASSVSKVAGKNNGSGTAHAANSDNQKRPSHSALRDIHTKIYGTMSYVSIRMMAAILSTFACTLMLVLPSIISVDGGGYEIYIFVAAQLVLYFSFHELVNIMHRFSVS